MSSTKDLASMCSGSSSSPSMPSISAALFFSLIAIQSHYENGRRGQDDCDDISNLILQQIRVRNATSDFGADTMYIFKQTNQRYLEDDDGQYEYFTKILVFEANVLSDA